MDFAGKEGLELPDELLDSVAGGGLPDPELPPDFWDSIIKKLEWREPEHDILKDDYSDFIL